jgi:hypothetical protein
MKILIALFSLFVILASCKKEEHIAYKTYPIHIKFSRWQAPGTKLVLSDTNTGEVLDDLELPPDPNEFIGSFTVRANLVVDTIDMHIISPAFELPPFFAESYIESYIAVPVGSFVHFSPFESFTQAEKTYLIISEINSFDTLTTGYIYPGKVVHDPVENNIYVEVFLGNNYGCLLRLKANNASDFRYYYLPDTLAGDTVQLKWSDFKQELDFRPINFPSNHPSQSFRVEAVSPDFSKSISINTTPKSSSTPGFNLPNILPNDWLLHVRMSMGNRVCEHIFSQQEPLVFHPSDITLEDLAISGNQISVSTSGDVDWISLNGEGDFNWEVNGPVEAFKKMILPNLSSFLAPNLKQNSLEWNRVLLKRFDQHNAEDIRAGIPNSSPGFYPVGRSGYHDAMYYR